MPSEPLGVRATAETHASVVGEVRGEALGADLGCGRASCGTARDECELVTLFPEHARERQPMPDDPPVTSADRISTSMGSLQTQRPPRGRRPLACREREGDGSLRSTGVRRSGRRFSSPCCGGPTVPAVAVRCRLDLAARRQAVCREVLGRAARDAARGPRPGRAEDLLVGLDPADDAAVYRLDDDRALVFTVDFFPPLVDDPRAFGAIAATNALNDVFAMGGVPLLALSIAAFPEELPTEVLGEVLAGADERVRAAGAILAGGHTIRDSEPKYGLAVVGTVHPDAIWPKAGAQPGDALFLTKPLGTGIVLQADRDGVAPHGALDGSGRSDARAEQDAADALRPFAPNAVTDVTGFGLLGHVHELASRSGVRAIVEAPRYLRSRLRSSSPRPESALVAIAGIASSRARTSCARARAAVEALAYDPQTAGGLLVSLPGERGPSLEATFWSKVSSSRESVASRAEPGSCSCSGPIAARELGSCRRCGFLRLAFASCVALFLVVTSGAFVRLTGSGLGCENWPSAATSHIRSRASTRSSSSAIGWSRSRASC